MKKLIAILVVAFAAQATIAEDSYLYWLVNDANYNGAAVNFNYATISADNGSSFLNLYSPSYTEPGVTAVDAVGGGLASSTDGGVFAGFNTGVTSFLVELWLDDGTRVGWQQYATSALGANITSGTSASGATALEVSSVVPEPTSGLMMLLGLAALALKRRKHA